ncbi:MAG: hypothetical protein H5T64_07045 [Chloroflexi bacterium]|nr:hypothetical protein [Chloroflexota bacterium]
MRNLTDTLRAAVRSLRRTPAVEADIRDKQVRWETLYGDGWMSVGDLCAACVAGSTIVRVMLETDGEIWTQVITDVNQESQWQWGDPNPWVLRASNALPPPYGDVAIVRDDNGTIRVFFFEGTYTRLINEIQSTDGGYTWSAKRTVKNLGNYSGNYYFRIAAGGGEAIFYATSIEGMRYVYRCDYNGGSVLQITNLVDEYGPEFDYCRGLAVAYHDSKWYLVAAIRRLQDSRIVSTVVSEGSWTTPQRIVPPGYASAGFDPWWPSLTYCEGATEGQVWALIYIDDFSASGMEWRMPMYIKSRDFDHWSYATPLNEDMTNLHRVCATWFNLALYANSEATVNRARFYYGGHADMNWTCPQSRILGYWCLERPGHGRLVVDLDNSDGALNDLGQPGATEEAVKLLSVVVLKQGYTTSSGRELVEMRPFFIDRIERRVGASGTRWVRPSAWVRLYCVDGWELFRRWKADATFTFKGKTVKWVIEELAARVGFFSVMFDGSPEWDTIVENVAVSGHILGYWGRYVRAWGRWWPADQYSGALETPRTGLQVLNDLLSLVGGRARWGSGFYTGGLYCFIPWKQSSDPPTDYDYGTSNEILRGSYLVGVVGPTRVRAVGYGAGYQVKDIQRASELGMDTFDVVSRRQWNTVQLCWSAAEAVIRDSQAMNYSGWFEAGLNPALELFDFIGITDARAGLASAKRRVVGIEHVWEPGRGTYQQRVWIEGV